MIASPVLGVLLLLLGSLLPGYLLSVTWGKDWIQELEFSERLYLQLLGGLILNSWLLLLLAELEAFSLSVILISWIVICMLLAWIGRSRLRIPSLPRPKLSWWSVAPVLLLILAGFLFAHPSESFLVFDDSGIYTLGGVHLAKTGSLFIKDPMLASLSPEMATQLLFLGPFSSSPTRFWGQFFIWQWNQPWVIFGLLHMQRLWAALFVLCLGLYGGLWVAPVFGIIATAGLYFLGRRLFTPAVGLLSATLLTLNFVQIYFARYPVSEMLTQSFLIGGYYLLILFLQKRYAWIGALAGICLGGLFLARLDAVLVGGLLLVLTMYWKLNGQWHTEYAYFGLALALSLGYAALHNVAYAWPYLILPWQISGNPTLTKALLLGGLCFASVVLVALLRPKLVSPIANWLSIHAWRVLAGGTLALVLLISLYYTFSKGGWNGRAITWLVQYWTPLGICLAAGGLILLLLRRPTRRVLPFLSVGLAYLTLFSLNSLVTPVQPWAMRRFVPIVMPALALLTAYAITTLPPLRFQLHHFVQTVVIGALVITFVRTNWPFINYEECRELGKQLAQFAHRFEKGAVILLDDGDINRNIAQPLLYLHDLNAFVLQRPNPEPALIDPFIESLQQRGTPVYLVLAGGALDWHPQRWAFLPRGAFTLYTDRIERTSDHPPTKTEALVRSFDIYQVVPSTARSVETSAVYALNMEAGEYSYLRGGFYNWETTPTGITYRWTDGLARIELPYLEGGDALLRLQVAGGRPDGVEEARLSVVVNDTPVVQEGLPTGFTFQTVQVTVPRQFLSTDQQRVVIELQSNSWIPADRGYGADVRKLGVAVDAIEWQAMGIDSR